MTVWRTKKRDEFDAFTRILHVNSKISQWIIKPVEPGIWENDRLVGEK